MDNVQKQALINAPFMRELIRTCANMYRLGWNERNGGNISVILDNDVTDLLDGSASLAEFDTGIGSQAEGGGLGGKIMAVTRTGGYFKNVEHDPEYNLGIIRLSPDSRRARLLWGFKNSGRPTSELPSHLRSHMARLACDTNHRVVTHCHPANTTAMTYIHPLDDREFSRTLWRMETECIVVFPEGVGVLPWMLCGNDEIGWATSKKMETCRVCVWAHHGVFAAGASLDETFGLLETVEKAAEIYMKTAGHAILNTISDGELRHLAETFNVKYRKDFLD